ncbi:non-heme iron oxygenase ferredoxin subunit [Pseudonocardia yuanmonensis]|uniref:Non-heme iron oxygenase ferredoxin subunit n=1 Tax=Pseudonocardia yuanmonensis TaxID=1095914 RepID=A0ABP8WGL6_9PSEU
MAREVVAALDELAVGDTVQVELAEPICLVRLGEADVRAIHDVCSHQGQPLHEGAVEDDTLVCAAHAARFDLSTGESVGIPEVAAVPVYRCVVENGEILVDLDDQLNSAEPA